jgi:hypothetical protein
VGCWERMDESVDVTVWVRDRWVIDCVGSGWEASDCCRYGKGGLMWAGR